MRLVISETINKATMNKESTMQTLKPKYAANNMVINQLVNLLLIISPFHISVAEIKFKTKKLASMTDKFVCKAELNNLSKRHIARERNFLKLN